MHIYLKGYYGYKNFWDELLLFGVIEEIFRRYSVEALVIEVGNKERIQKRIHQNKEFLNHFYRSRNIKIPWNTISFFEPHNPLSQKQYWIKKRKSYLQCFLGQHPYRSYFKVFGGGEVIDESRNFPHNGRSLLLLYARSIFHSNFTLRGGLGWQNQRSSRLLTKILLKYSKEPLLRDPHSYIYSQQLYHHTTQIKDFSTNLLRFFLKQYQAIPPHKSAYYLLNMSPAYNIKTLKSISYPLSDKQGYFFPCDMNFDPEIFHQHFPNLPLEIFDRTQHTLAEILTIIKNSEIWIWSRLHFLYCYKIFWKEFISLSSSPKIKYNLETK